MDDEIKNMLKDTTVGDLNPIVENYRAALDEQHTADLNALNNQRNLDYTTINSTANVKGMLHSNFPTRDKLKYDVNTYEPNKVKLQQSYQTGLDTLYSNAAKYLNQIKSYKEQIADYNDATTANTTTTTTGNILDDNYDTLHGYQFTDSGGNPITFYEYAQQQGWDNNTISSALQDMANANDFNATRAIAGLTNTDNGEGYKGNLTSEEERALQILGISTEGFGHRD